jgi:PAS domain S-box-containing protein
MVCVVVLGLDTLRSWNERNAMLAAGRAGSQNLARSVAQQADDTLRSADITILGLMERIDHDGTAPEQLNRLRAVMVARMAQFPVLVNFAVLDEHGRELVAAVPGEVSDTADQEYFRYHRDHDDRVGHIGAPIAGRPDGHWTIPLSRRFNHPDGSLAGVVMAALDMDYFLKFYDRFEMGPNGAIVLLRDDGILLVRRPFVASSIGSNLAATQLFLEYLPRAPTGDLETESTIDGITRLASYRRLDNFPLVATAALAKDEVLSPWRRRIRNHAVILGSMVFAIALFGAWLVRQIGRRERTERAMAALAEDYRLLAENSPNMVVRQGADGVRHYVNEELEARVSARTVELSELNHRLIEREAALRESAALLQATFDAAPFAIAVVALDFTLLNWNRAAEDMLGYSSDEMLGLSVLEFTPPEARGELRDVIARVSAGERLTGIERRRPNRHGQLVDVSVAAAPVFDAEQRVRAVIYTIEDITQKKIVEAQLRQAQKMEAIGNLTGGMAHDFNNLLGIVIGNLDILVAQRPDDADIKLMAGEALQAGLRGGDLTRRLLAFARRQPLQPQRVDINQLVGDIVTLLSRVLGADIEISLDLGQELCPVKVDPALLESALTNLANNARDAMPGGGRLMISTALRHLDADYIAQHPELEPGDYAMIEVSDTGTGMPASIMAQIFEPFFTTKDRDRGSGLGLSMVFGFMKQSGGHINVYSEEGSGTTFRLYLPCTMEAVDVGEHIGRIAPVVQGENETVLVVEDNLPLRRIVVRQLISLGYRAVVAGTAGEALAILEAEPIDLMFTDVILPGGMDGFELARLVGERFPTVKTVLTSGFPEARLESTLALANLRLLSKPYRKEDLASALRDALTASGL